MNSIQHPQSQPGGAAAALGRLCWRSNFAEFKGLRESVGDKGSKVISGLLVDSAGYHRKLQDSAHFAV